MTVSKILENNNNNYVVEFYVFLQRYNHQSAHVGLEQSKIPSAVTNGKLKTKCMHACMDWCRKHFIE